MSWKALLVFSCATFSALIRDASLQTLHLCSYGAPWFKQYCYCHLNIRYFAVMWLELYGFGFVYSEISLPWLAHVYFLNFSFFFTTGCPHDQE